MLTRPFCNFCEEHHDPKTCEVLKHSKERVFGKRPDSSVNALDWVDDDDVFAVTTRSQSQKNSDYNRNYIKNPPLNNTIRRNTNFRNNNQQSTATNLDSKYNIVEDLAKIKASATLLDLARVPEQ